MILKGRQLFAYVRGEMAIEQQNIDKSRGVVLTEWWGLHFKTDPVFGVCVCGSTVGRSDGTLTLIITT
jgi:hypothetical protein